MCSAEWWRCQCPWVTPNHHNSSHFLWLTILSQPVEGKSSLNGRGQDHMVCFKFWGFNHVSRMTEAGVVRFYIQVGHMKSLALGYHGTPEWIWMHQKLLQVSETWPVTSYTAVTDMLLWPLYNPVLLATMVCNPFIPVSSLNTISLILNDKCTGGVEVE